MSPSTVGRFPVIVQLGGARSADNVTIDRMCGAGFFGLIGDSCQLCPQVRPLTQLDNGDGNVRSSTMDCRL